MDSRGFTLFRGPLHAAIPVNSGEKILKTKSNVLIIQLQPRYMQTLEQLFKLSRDNCRQTLGVLT